MSSYLSYPHRSAGMDHDRYAWSPIYARPAIRWPSGAGLALSACISLEWFRFDNPKHPVPAQGAPTKEYPDYREWTLRDYGLRVGVFRLIEVLRSHGITPTVAINAEVCRRFPALIEGLGDCEIVGHGETASLPAHPGLSEAEERDGIRRSLETVRNATGQPVRGWLSPSQIETPRTLDLLAAEGIEYTLDWVNDDVPYEMRTTSGPLCAVPGPWELSDINAVWTLHHTSQEFGQQIVDGIALLAAEAAEVGGRTLTIGLRPWIMGQAHRIGDLDDALRRALAGVSVWAATAGEIVDAFRSSGTASHA